MTNGSKFLSHNPIIKRKVPTTRSTYLQSQKVSCCDHRQGNSHGFTFDDQRHFFRNYLPSSQGENDSSPFCQSSEAPSVMLLRLEDFIIRDGVSSVILFLHNTRYIWSLHPSSIRQAKTVLIHPETHFPSTLDSTQRKKKWKRMKTQAVKEDGKNPIFRIENDGKGSRWKKWKLVTYVHAMPFTGNEGWKRNVSKGLGERVFDVKIRGLFLMLLNMRSSHSNLSLKMEGEGSGAQSWDLGRLMKYWWAIGFVWG